jgi:serine/threonine protein kinase
LPQPEGTDAEEPEVIERGYSGRCVFPACGRFGEASSGRFCASCRRPLGGPCFGPEPGYRLETYLDSGYFADVFRARDLASDLILAAKVYGDTPPRRRAWSREWAALRELAHPRVPALHAAFVEDRTRFVAMELLAGPSLRDEVEARGPLPVESVVTLGREAGEALEYVASRGWTYRDLHPRNLHRNTPKGTMLLDFDGARPPGFPARPAGRIGYRAPELAAEGQVTAAADVYSLAGCLYFALLGVDPPTAPGPLLALRGPLSPYPRLADLLDAARRADPAQRPSMGELRAVLGLQA